MATLFIRDLDSKDGGFGKRGFAEREQALGMVIETLTPIRTAQDDNFLMHPHMHCFRTLNLCMSGRYRGDGIIRRSYKETLFLASA